MSKPVYVRDILNYFGYRQVVGNDESLNRQIMDSNVNRPGLELSGYFLEPTKRIVVMGEKEIHYINQKMSLEQQQAAFDFLTSDNVPMIVVSRDLPVPQVLLDIAYKKNFPVFSSYATTSFLIVDLINYLEEYFAMTDNIYGVLLKVYNHGVLLTGESGIGKSELAIELIRKGHVLIADDRVDIFRAHNHIYGEAPPILRNYIELRGVGVLNIKDMYGYAASEDRSEIEVVIELKKQNDNDEYDRLGIDNHEFVEYQGVIVPIMTIP